MKTTEKAPLLLSVLAIALALPAACQPDFIHNPLSTASQFLSGLLGGGSLPNVPTIPGIPLAGLPMGLMDPSHALVESAPALPGDGAAAPAAAPASSAMTPLDGPIASLYAAGPAVGPLEGPMTSLPAAGSAAQEPVPGTEEDHGDHMHVPHGEATRDLSHMMATAQQIAEEVHKKVAEEAGALRAALRQRLATGAPARRMLRGDGADADGSSGDSSSGGTSGWDASGGGSRGWDSSDVPTDTWAGHATGMRQDSMHSRADPSADGSSSGSDGSAAPAPQQAAAAGGGSAGAQGESAGGITGMEVQIVETADLLFSLLTGAVGLGASVPDRNGMHPPEAEPAMPMSDTQASEGKGHHTHDIAGKHEDGEHGWAHPAMPRHKPEHWDGSAWAAAAPDIRWEAAGPRNDMRSMHPDTAWAPADGPAMSSMAARMRRHHHHGKHHRHATDLVAAPVGSPAAGPTPDMQWAAAPAAAPDVPAWSWPPAVDAAAPAP